MNLIDVNLLLYAYNPSFERHMPARRWLETVLSRPEPVGLSWMVLLAFLRIGTNPHAFERPLSVREASTIVSEWLSLPMVQVVEPSERHWTILESLLRATGARGPVIMDAHLAALAIEHGATLCTTDRDFQRFPGLRTQDPISTPRSRS